MHRALPALALTAVGVGLVLSFDTDPSGSVELVGEATTQSGTGTAGAAAPATTAPAPTATTDAPADTQGPAATSPATSSPATSSPATSPATSSPATTDPATTSPAADTLTVTGPVASTRYGPVQVQVVVADGALVDVVALQLPSGDPHTNRISDQVAPMLRRAALAAQNADIDVVSGATFTWRGYVASLQAALDAAGL